MALQRALQLVPFSSLAHSAALSNLVKSLSALTLSDGECFVALSQSRLGTRNGWIGTRSEHRKNLAITVSRSGSLLRSTPMLAVGYTKPPSAPPKAVYHRLLGDNGQLNVAIFELGPGAQLPPHNHPEMCVLSKVLSGNMQAVTFTRTGSGLSVRCKRNTVLTASDATHVTLPVEENVHTFRNVGEEPVVVLDILSPPYTGERHISYFAVRPRSETLQSGVPSRDVLPPQFRAEALPWSATPGTEYSLHVLKDGPTDFETFERPYCGTPITLPHSQAARLHEQQLR